MPGRRLLRRPSIGATLGQRIGLIDIRVRLTYPSTRLRADAGIMLAQRLRRWANSTPSLAQRLAFAVIVVSCLVISLSMSPVLRVT